MRERGKLDPVCEQPALPACAGQKSTPSAFSWALVKTSSQSQPQSSLREVSGASSEEGEGGWVSEVGSKVDKGWDSTVVTREPTGGRRFQKPFWDQGEARKVHLREAREPMGQIRGPSGLPAW